MDNEKNKVSSILNNRLCPARIVPESINLFTTDFNENFLNQCSPTVLLALGKEKDEQYIDINLLDLNLPTDFGFPHSSKNISNEHKSQARHEDKYENNAFDFHLNVENEITSSSLFDNHEGILFNCEIINKLNDNSTLSEQKDKVGWDTENYENETSFGDYEENSWNFSEENVGENVESLTRSWNLGEISYNTQLPNNQIITPKKTVDITKIKGWKKKKFIVQGSPSVYSNDSIDAYINSYTSPDREELTPFITENETMKIKNETVANKKSTDDANINYAFVCDRLDNFLDEEAELNINYEIPHLYAEFGIKLTSEELVSRPKFESTSEEKLKHFAPTTINNTENLQVSDGSVTKSLGANMRYKKSKRNSPKKRSYKSYKSNKSYQLNKKKNIIKNENPRSRGRLIKKNFMNKNKKDIAKCSRRSFRIKQSKSTHEVNSKKNYCSDERDRTEKNDSKKFLKNKKTFVKSRTVSLKCNRKKKRISNFLLKVFSLGMVVYPGPFAPLNQFIRFHLQKLRSYRTSIDKNWATFAASAVISNFKLQNRRRMILPVKCCFKYKEESPLKNQSGKLNPNGSDISGKSGDESASFNDDFQVIKDVVEYLIKSVSDESEKEVKDLENVSHSSAEKIENRNSDCEVPKNVFSNKKLLFNACKNESENENSDLEKKLVMNSNARYNLRDHSLSLKRMSSFYHCNRADHKSLNNSNAVNDNLEHCKKENNVLSVEHKQDALNECKNIEATSESDVLEERSQKVSLKNSDVSTEIDDSNALNNNMHTPLKLNQMSFDNAVTKLLTEKLNVLKAIHHENSIDVLKNMKPNVLELIKLNFVKENFLSGYINIWYVKFENRARSRVYLTFTKNPPMAGAINLKMSSRILREELPNVINEIITKDKQFDSNDFAILFCDGKLWEIHGSVNFTVDNNKGRLKFDETIQVYHLTKKMLPELHYLKEIKFIDNKNKVSKWWIMNMLQKCTEILIKYGDEIGKINCTRLMQSSNPKVSNFILFNGIRRFLPVGISINPRFWPYVLIGPFDVNDNHKLGLKLHHKIVPFEYYLPLDRINSDFLLPKFVSSVIVHSWKNNKQVVGMWLYDKTLSERSSFIEVKTKYKNIHDYQREIEHDYSSSQMQNVLDEVNLDDVPKHIRGSVGDLDGSVEREIYLVPNIPGLGYLKGMLLPDRSIIIEHPLKPNRKIKSHRIGEWLNKIMRRRITFIPNDLNLRWKIVSDVRELDDQKPLSKFSLGGTHILCKKGLFYLLSMTREKIHNLGLNESFVLKIIMENPIIEEVIQVKELGKLLLKKDECDLDMSEVLHLAVKEIEALEEEKIYLRKLKDTLEKKREYLCRKYINVLENCDIDENMKKTIYFYIRKILHNKSRKIILHNGKSENCQCLEAINEFLLKSIKDSEMGFHESETNVDAIIESIENRIVTSSEDPDKKEKCLNGTSFNVEQFNLDNETVRKLEMKIIYLYDILSKCKLENASVQQKLTARLNMLSDYLDKIKKKSDEIDKFLPSFNDVQLPILSPNNENGYNDSGESLSLPDVISSLTENEKKLDFETNSSLMDAIYDYSLNIVNDDISFKDINKYLCEKSDVLSNSHLMKSIDSEYVMNFKDNKIKKSPVKSFRLESLLKKHKKAEDSENKNAISDLENKELDYNKSSLNEEEEDEDEDEDEEDEEADEKEEEQEEGFSTNLSEHKLAISSKETAKETNKHSELSHIPHIYNFQDSALLKFSKNNITQKIPNECTETNCLDSFRNEKEKDLSRFKKELDLEYEGLSYQNRLHCDEQKCFTPYKKFFERNEGVDFNESFEKYIAFELPKDTPLSETVSADRVFQNANYFKNGKRIILLRKRKLSEEDQIVLLKKLKNN